MSSGGHDDPFAYMPFIWRPEYASMPSGHSTTAVVGRDRDRRDLAAQRAASCGSTRSSSCSAASSCWRTIRATSSPARWSVPRAPIWCAAGSRRGGCLLLARPAAFPGPSLAADQAALREAVRAAKPSRQKQPEISMRLNPAGCRFRSLRHVEDNSVDELASQGARPYPQSRWSCRCATKPAISRRWSPRSPRALQGSAFEIVYVNDGSNDATEQELRGLMAEHPWLRQIRHEKSCGQSAAVRTGVAAWRVRPIVVTLDGDGQNDPAFIPALIAELEAGAPRVGLVAGQRVGRKATGFKKLQSRVANAVRNAVLKDGTRDTGCGLKAFRRDAVPGAALFRRACTAFCRRWCGARASTSVMSTSSTGRAATARRITVSGTGCGSAFSISPACGGSSGAESAFRNRRR